MLMNDYEKENIKILRGLAAECTVLLKSKGDFPLSAPEKIALYGSGARQTIKGGTGSGDVNSRFYVTAEQGLEEAGFTVSSKAWLDQYDAVRKEAYGQFIADLKQKAKQQHVNPLVLGMGAVMPEPAYSIPLDAEGETAVYVLGRVSGEGNDRIPDAGDIKLSATEIRDILECTRKYPRFMLVLNVGGVVDLSPVVSQVDNILVLSQLGVVTGNVLADLLLGTSVPSGKLTTTWSAWEDYSTIGTFGDPTDTLYKEGVYVGYRYFDSVGKQAMFPFGFGLGYTVFSLGQPTAVLEGTTVRVSMDVTNTGRFAGKEVLQVYVSVPWGKLDQPYQSLAAFAKTKLLAPGDKETVTASFRMEDLAGFDTETAAYILEKGSYVVRAGTSSRDTVPCTLVELDDTVTVRQLIHVGGTPSFTDWKPEEIKFQLPENLPVLKLSADAFADLKHPVPFQSSAAAKKKAAGLTDEQLIYLCIGAFKEGLATFVNVIGSASSNVAGAAGESCGKVAGVPALVMADGPAGLRLSQHYTRDSKGHAHAIGSAFPAGMEELLGKRAAMMMKLTQRKPKGEILDQYCTAIPIGTGLAQSWNLALCETCGDLVGQEMERFGVDLWLAPAFNIHRSPLCGRNFEYYSEDPLISGLVGAAITKGVQKHPGRGTTIKHFCCNNQELCRYNSNSQVSERALREIYLRGFQICIAESQPRALMTSYNLLNGIHTSERADLMKTVLREEWGYEGLVMTDWVVSFINSKSKYRAAKSAPTIAAGNDVFMPGCPGDYKLALTALKGKNPEFTLTREQAEYCAAHLIDIAWRMKGEQVNSR